MSKKGFLAVALAVLAAGVASAQVTISGGFALSYMNANVAGEGANLNIKGDVGAGGNIYLDYLLPIGVPLSLGVEFGADSSSFTMPGYKDTVLAIPLLLRAAYHFDLHPKVDLYLVGKIGWVFGAWSGDNYDEAKNTAASIDPDPPMETLINSGFQHGGVFCGGNAGREAKKHPLPAQLRPYSGHCALPAAPFCPCLGNWAHLSLMPPPVGHTVSATTPISID
jgi:hypothetical protein